MTQCCSLSCRFTGWPIRTWCRTKARRKRYLYLVELDRYYCPTEIHVHGGLEKVMACDVKRETWDRDYGREGRETEMEERRDQDVECRRTKEGNLDLASFSAFWTDLDPCSAQTCETSIVVNYISQTALPSSQRSEPAMPRMLATAPELLCSSLAEASPTPPRHAPPSPGPV